MSDPTIKTTFREVGEVQVERPAPLPKVKKDGRAVVESMTDRRLESMKRLAKMDRAAYKHLVDHLRAKNPQLTASLTDEQIIATVFMEANREAAEAAFKQLGRDKVVIP